MPTKLRKGGMPTEEVAALVAMLALPWALKFLWAPAIDSLRGPRWGYRAWISTAQVIMGLTLLPLALLPVEATLSFITLLLLSHAIAAATQDVAIDAYAINTIDPDDRGRTTGWMQAGMLIGRGVFGGLALAAEAWIGPQAVVAVLIGCIWLTLAVLWTAPDRRSQAVDAHAPTPHFFSAILTMLGRRATWIGLAIALTAGAGFEAVGGLMGPYLTDRGTDSSSIGWFLAVPVLASMIVGSLGGGWMADRFGHRLLLGGSVTLVFVWIVVLAIADRTLGLRGPALMATIVPIYLLLGILVSSSYAMFMDLTDPELGGTQFSTFMGATNLCEVWAVAWAGRIAGGTDAPPRYIAAFLACGAVSLVAIGLLRWIPGRRGAATG